MWEGQGITARSGGLATVNVHVKMSIWLAHVYHKTLPDFMRGVLSLGAWVVDQFGERIILTRDRKLVTVSLIFYNKLLPNVMAKT